MKIRSIQSLKGFLIGALLALRLSSAHADDPVILDQPIDQSVLVGDDTGFSITVSNDVPVPTGNPGANGVVYATAVDGSGNLYIGGDFTDAGDVLANNIAKWDGTNWSALGSGIGGSDGFFRPHVVALAVLGGDLYVGGAFLTAGGIPASHIAKWDGTNWSAVGSGMNSAVYALAVSGGDLYAGGGFTTAGGNAADRIAKWDGSNWSALGSGLNNGVGALAVSGSDLYVAGSFTNAGGIAANRVAMWNGSSWSALGSGVNGSVIALAASGGDLYAAGSFSSAGGIAVTNFAKWNGGSWSALASLSASLNTLWVNVNDLAISGGDLYAAIDFEVSLGGNASAYRAGVAKWNGSTWSALGAGVGWGWSDDGDPYVGTLAVSGSNVYAGGAFRRAGDYPAHCIAKWHGDDWLALGGNTPAFTFQWQLNGVDLPNGGGIRGARTFHLILDDVQVSQAGSYRVAVSSSNSTVFSSSALLSVSTNTLANALDTEGTPFVWGSTAPWPWFSQSAVTHDGVDAARTGPVADLSGSSGLTTTVTGPGILTFWWKVSAKPPYDGLHFSAGYGQLAALLGEVDWQQRTFNIPSGNHLLSWYYWHDGGSSGDPGEDCGWVDQVQFTPTCTVSIPSASEAHPRGFSTGTVSVAAAPDCTWGVSSLSPWVTILSATNGTGNGIVTYLVATNPTASYRNGTIQVADKGFIVIQQNTPPPPPPPCTYAVSNSSTTHGFGSSRETITVTTPGHCTWSFLNTNSWIWTPPNGGLWSGSTFFPYDVSDNPSTSPRSGYIRVANQNVLVTQSGYNPDPITLAEALNTPGSSLTWTTGGDAEWFGQRPLAHDGVGAGASGAIGDSQSSFVQTVVTGPGLLTFWWRVSSHSGSSLSNSDALSFSVSGVEQGRIRGLRSWEQGTAIIPAGNQTLEWRYAKNPSDSFSDDRGWVDEVQFVPSPGCPVALTPGSDTHPASSSTGSISVAAASDCAWHVLNTNNWISITAGATGLGNGTVQYTVTATTNVLARSGSIYIGDQIFSITQAGGGTGICNYALSRTNNTHNHGPVTAWTIVIAQADCPWSVVNTNDWITFTSPTNMTGGGVAIYNVAPNTSALARTGMVVIAGKIFTVTQSKSPDPCAAALTPSSRFLNAYAQTAIVSVYIPAGCGWDVVNTNTWISALQGTDGGSNYVQYTVTENTSTWLRKGTLIIGGQPFTVTQLGARTMAAPSMQIVFSPETGVLLTIHGNAGRTHIVECSPDTVSWTQIASGVMPPHGSMQVTDATKHTHARTCFYRTVELP